MKDVLIIVDMLNDFVDTEKGALAFPKAKEIVNAIREKLDAYRDADKPIIYICDAHDPDDEEFKRFPKHAVKGTWGAEIINELRPLSKSYKQNRTFVLTKTRYSGFFSTDLDRILQYFPIDTVEVCGVCTSICVMDTVGGLANRDYKTFVDMDAIADFDNDMHDFAIKRMEAIYGTEIELPMVLP